MKRITLLCCNTLTAIIVGSFLASLAIEPDPDKTIGTGMLVFTCMSISVWLLALGLAFVRWHARLRRTVQ